MGRKKGVRRRGSRRRAFSSVSIWYNDDSFAKFYIAIMEDGDVKFSSRIYDAVLGEGFGVNHHFEPRLEGKFLHFHRVRGLMARWPITGVDKGADWRRGFIEAYVRFRLFDLGKRSSVGVRRVVKNYDLMDLFSHIE